MILCDFNKKNGALDAFQGKKLKVFTQYLLRSMFVALVGSIVSCSSFDSVLPDRKKEYKYSTELPPLEVPPELSTSSIEDNTIRSRGGSVSARELQSVRQPQTSTRQPEVVEKTSLVENSTEGTYIKVEEDYAIAWRMVGRALSRLEIEVDDLNRTEGMYYVIYEDKKKKDSAGGLFSSLAFWSDENAISESDLRVKLSDRGGSTEIRVLDDNGEVQNSGDGLRLLQILQEKLNELGLNK